MSPFLPLKLMLSHGTSRPRPHARLHRRPAGGGRPLGALPRLFQVQPGPEASESPKIIKGDVLGAT